MSHSKGVTFSVARWFYLQNMNELVLKSISFCDIWKQMSDV